MIRKYDDLNVGDWDSFEKTISESDIYMFAGVTGDFNPAHVNQIKAENSIFKGRIAHGMLVGSLISTVLGMKLPGEGTIYLSQELKFKAPVHIGDTIKATVTITEKLERGRIKLNTICTNQKDEIVVEGQATVLAPK